MDMVKIKRATRIGIELPLITNAGAKLFKIQNAMRKTKDMIKGELTKDAHWRHAPSGQVVLDK